METSFFTGQCTLRISIALVKAIAQGVPEEMLFPSLKAAEPQLCWTTLGSWLGLSGTALSSLPALLHSVC